ncbi:hypothetical protein [Paenibacillus pini]|uniref:Uncharacterized protein n=1 Tax=Paenibacillus pini JCM 16418 TaxID=1236976 RepID=W7YNQ8_9BACL|nr:hypothetical protein [Paenibacillus pini]GAF09248.1 hypothetical protein JCM16418_3372 [Paenibacillus pini JCM 16418]
MDNLKATSERYTFKAFTVFCKGAGLLVLCWGALFVCAKGALLAYDTIMTGMN